MGQSRTNVVLCRDPGEKEGVEKRYVAQLSIGSLPRPAVHFSRYTPCFRIRWLDLATSGFPTNGFGASG